MNDDDRNHYSNLILMCPNHHTVIDETEVDRHPVDVVIEMKRLTEEAGTRSEFSRILSPSELDRVAQLLLLTMGPAEPGSDANFSVRFSYRDSARTWGRAIATNEGPGRASTVAIHLESTKEGGWQPVPPIRGQGSGQADSLAPGESVNTSVAFAFGSPTLEDIRYRLSWQDESGESREQVGQLTESQ